MSCERNTPESSAPITFAEIVRRYISDYREDARRELLFYAIQPTLERALEKAALCKLPSGKRHSHQQRIPGPVLEHALNLLRKLNFDDVKSFDQLHSLVKDTILPIRGIGDLTVYDIAHRIGTKLGLEPEQVYLHAGTRTGARALGFRGEKIDRLDLVKRSAAFAELSAAELEDCLCLYKAELNDIIRMMH